MSNFEAAAFVATGVSTLPGVKANPTSSGALSTTTFVSGTGKQILTTRDVFLTIPYTGAASAGTLAVALSPDNTTYTTLHTLALPASATGYTLSCTLAVPAGWWVKLTASNITIGTCTLY
jgi:hypothetical protein